MIYQVSKGNVLHKFNGLDLYQHPLNYLINHIVAHTVFALPPFYTYYLYLLKNPKTRPWPEKG